jgi:hypothetical protein
MRGHVRKRGNTWAVIYDEGRDENGKRRQRWRGGFATKKEASAFLTDVLSKLGDSSYVAPSKVTLGDYLTAEWLPALEASNELRPLTRTQYRSVVRTRIKPRSWLASLRLQAITPAHVKRLLGELKEEGLSDATGQLTRAVLSRALADAVEDQKLARKPCRSPGAKRICTPAGAGAREGVDCARAADIPRARR